MTVARCAAAEGLVALAARRPGGGGCPPQARPQLLGYDLDDLAGAAVFSGPAPLLESANDHHSAALGQGLGGVLGLVAPHDHGEERRLLLPPPRDGHPEHGPGDPAFGVVDLGVVVRLPTMVVVVSGMRASFLGFDAGWLGPGRSLGLDDRYLLVLRAHRAW